MPHRTYSKDEVTAWLERHLPEWRYEDAHLVRTYETGGWARTQLLAGAIAFLGEAAWHHPDLTLSFPRLVVRLQSHDAGGVTDRDLELARRIESLVTWQPDEESVFSGPPDGWIT